MKRNTAQILSQEPQKVILGGEEFAVKPLVIKKARKFRKALLQTIASAGGIDLESSEGVQGLTQTLEHFFDEQLIDLCKLAIPEFENKQHEWIEDNVAEAELQEALVVAVTVNFPWLKKMVELGSLGQVMNQAQKASGTKTANS